MWFVIGVSTGVRTECWGYSVLLGCWVDISGLGRASVVIGLLCWWTRGLIDLHDDCRLACCYAYEMMGWLVDSWAGGMLVYSNIWLTGMVID